MEREGTWSRNASLPLRPATSYHAASADRRRQEGPIIELLGPKQAWTKWEERARQCKGSCDNLVMKWHCK